MQLQLLQADKNIRYYIYIRVFAKRVFLPLTAIYFMDYAKLTIIEIGWLSAFFSIIQLLAEVPTGYFADRIGRVASIRFGATLAAMATTIYAFVQHKTGIILGVGFEALGYCFMGGAGEALIHDSLHLKNEVNEYTRVMSNNMAISLIVNAVLVSLATYAYRINPHLPFILGTFCYLLLLLATTQLKDIYPPKTKKIKLSLPNTRFLLTHKSMLLFGITFGIISALYTSPNDMFNIALKEYGFRPEYLGIIYGLGSIAGALLGPFNKHFRLLSPSKYILLDGMVLLTLLAAAYSRNALYFAIIIIISISFWRYRRIIYQDYMLRIYPNAYKATLVSTLNNLEQVNAVWLPIAITSLITLVGLSNGFGVLFLVTLTILPLFHYSTKKFVTKNLV